MSVAPTLDPAARQVDRLIVLDELDRGLLAGRLHDGPVQDLLATRYLLDLALSAAADGADAATLALRLDAIRDAAATALSGSRALLNELTARSTDGRNLTGAVHAASGAASTGNAADGELPPAPPAIAVVVHRLVRALAQLAVPPVVSVTRTAASLDLTCNPAPVLTAPHLLGWMERAEMLGASVSVSASPETVIHFPLRPAPEGP